MFPADDISTQVGTFCLVPQIADAVEVPVIAAGGIADGQGIVATVVLGASAVQIATAFLFTPEARLAHPHKEASPVSMLTRPLSPTSSRVGRRAASSTARCGSLTPCPKTYRRFRSRAAPWRLFGPPPNKPVQGTLCLSGPVKLPDSVTDFRRAH